MNKDEAQLELRLDSYRRLADVFHHVLSERSLDSLLERVADTLAELIPYDTLTIYQAHAADRLLIPVLARDLWAEQIMNDRVMFGEGLTGRAAETRTPLLSNQAHLTPGAQTIPGTPENEPEALIIVPLVARGSIQGALNIYRLGTEGRFHEEEFELAKRFGDAAALALENAQSRAQLERLAHTDSLTGLYNHRFFYERLRSELTRASRSRDSVTLLMLDIDDFKRLNDVYGHGTGDQVLLRLAEMLGQMVRASDVVCRLGGEEFTVIMPSCDAGAALGLASRLLERLASTDFDAAGRITVSMGVAQGPEHAMNPRELVACADAAMMTAKARGKSRVVLFDETETERPQAGAQRSRDVRSIAHLKMLQSLAGKLNRLSNVEQIGNTIANELRTLIDYHNCRVYVAEGEDLVPIAFRGQLAEYGDETLEGLICKFGEGITGIAAETGRSLLIRNAVECEFAVLIPGTDDIEESIVAVPLTYGTRVIGVIVISKLGVGQFDEDDVRLLEVLAGNASVALENARLYEAQRREADNAKALLEFADAMFNAPSPSAIGQGTVRMSARLLDAEQTSLWLEDERSGDYFCAAHFGYVGDPTAEPVIRERVSKVSAEALFAGRDKPFVMSPSTTERYVEAPAGAVFRTLAIAPLQQMPGWITVRQPPVPGPYFSEERLRMLAGVSYQASLAMQKSSLYKDQKENADIANALLDFSSELATAQALEEVLDLTAAQAARLLGSPTTAVWLQDPHTKEVRAEALHGFAESRAAKIKAARVCEDVARPFVLLDRPFVVRQDMLEAMEGAAEPAEGHRHAVAPLKLDYGRAGFVIVEAPALGNYEFSERKMRLLAGIAHQAALAINNATGYENLERTFLSTVEALANALETKDEYTSSHARWITDMSLEVGRELGLDAAALKRLELGALFHDIGKIGIPHGILLKPGPLTPREWAVIQTHPELGERILRPIERLADVRPIVRHCHERFDGTGYPDGKRGEDIPLESRIIFVCDAFHAMTSDRPYRDRLPRDVASRRLKDSAGQQFDPKVVETFMALLSERPDLAVSG